MGEDKIFQMFPHLPEIVVAFIRNLVAQINSLITQLAGKDEELAAKEEEIRRLREQLNQNSGNSSMPPSF